ncbi:ParB-like nuclease domain protein [Streptomyces phage Yaboi]|uniref:ParB-like nuclease domain protein n=3 Tax=Streptomyces virus Yaboi TaxID=2846408 RepID=A0A411C4A3_9CAUD|nr:ParB-like nuclease domain protein [Streptomyces phage Yaboi]YP_009841362.1 ParB-like nuclease domain protein [Streptomyces phage Yaboi]QAY08672.1 ParB-like nuclease domain protein [Streptomyces phage Genie2]QAY12662.1 ParB-like nuclease domain protein [Streptomyces phage BoomerJR]UVD39858.1 ParB-like nuclease domain protein [Streptomyces phage Stanimal]WNM73599.1 ParB-like nuclease domain protein [Streptomyces phage Sollertia]AYB70849.1 ParB-like nuclease domain protein [Streptomyces phage
MIMANVEWLMKNAIFNDQLDGETKWEMFYDKLNHIDWEFVSSVAQHGIQAGCVYDFQTNTFYNGHHRLMIAYLLGIEEIPIFEESDDCFDWQWEELGWPGARG